MLCFANELFRVAILRALVCAVTRVARLRFLAKRSNAEWVFGRMPGTKVLGGECA
jgi:hypothetical protein